MKVRSMNLAPLTYFRPPKTCSIWPPSDFVFVTVLSFMLRINKWTNRSNFLHLTLINIWDGATHFSFYSHVSQRRIDRQSSHFSQPTSCTIYFSSSPGSTSTAAAPPPSCCSTTARTKAHWMEIEATKKSTVATMANRAPSPSSHLGFVNPST